MNLWGTKRLNNLLSLPASKGQPGLDPWYVTPESVFLMTNQAASGDLSDSVIVRTNVRRAAVVEMASRSWCLPLNLSWRGSAKHSWKWMTEKEQMHPL